jgi:hypothetical protein
VKCSRAFIASHNLHSLSNLSYVSFSVRPVENSLLADADAESEIHYANF